MKYNVRGRWDIHDNMTFKVIRGHGQGEEMTRPLSGLFLHSFSARFQIYINILLYYVMQLIAACVALCRLKELL